MSSVICIFMKRHFENSSMGIRINNNHTFGFKNVSPNTTMTGLLEEPEDFHQTLQNMLVNCPYAIFSVRFGGT